MEFLGVEAKADQNSLKLQPTLVGTLVTITDTHMAMVDGPTLRYSLLVPKVLLAPNQNSQEFSTVAVRTAVANPLLRPEPSAPIVDNNTFVTVRCTATAVLF
jgi:hypothetical protein